MSTSPPPKKARTTLTYSLLYHSGIPGRGEYIRLLFEATNTPYTDVANTVDDGYLQVHAALEKPPSPNSPIFAPPALSVPGAGRDGSTLLISQTPNILGYLGPELGLTPEDKAGQLWVQEIALTALDLSNEAHDSHHPIAVSLYYEDQKREARRRAKDFRENRIPKFLSYFEAVLKNNQKEGKGHYLVDSKLTYADTTVWQVLDGIHFAFPNEMAYLKKSGKYSILLGTFYRDFKEENGIKEYLTSNRRLEFGMGLYRCYPELDRKSG
ncbi:MAG: hypothetical protein M1834_006496 [Cirrosporium novae-zelandiae]|nr:MAG: hypothetical protein M1834_006496 [Cirrosporium novae-zelandiae]